MPPLFPLLVNVIAELKRYREQNSATTLVFEGPRVFPLDLATLGSKHIKKALQSTGIKWHGFPAFRRGFGTRLYNSGVKLDLVGRNSPSRLFGSDVTLKHYVEVAEETKANALKNLPQKA